MSNPRDNDFSAEDSAETQAWMANASNGEFERLKRSLRRAAGLDLTWYERLYKRVASLFGIRVVFK